MNLNLGSAFMRDTSFVQSADSGNETIAKIRLHFVLQIIICYALIIVSLVQISLKSPDKELWLITQFFYQIHFKSPTIKI